VARDKNNSSKLNSSIGAMLPFLFYSMLCVVLMLVDNRFSFSQYLRKQSNELLMPVWWAVGRPFALWQMGNDVVKTNADLHQQVTKLQNKQLKSDLALQQLWLLQAENKELRALLNTQQRLSPTAQIAELVSMSPDASQRHFIINQGAQHDVTLGQVVLDANGLAGQVIEVFPRSSIVIAITDADHAIPVMVTRSGFRSIVFGQGNDRNLSLANLTPSDDVKVGDILVTSGVGGRFPAGIPVGVVKAFQQVAVMTFLNAEITPFARLGYGRHMLLLKEIKETPVMPTKPEALPITVDNKVEKSPEAKP
jgi:rod shape-determining protein MreC